MYESIRRIFSEVYGDNGNPVVVRSPGRINLIGEHTDYNNGFVLPAAIDKAAYMALSLRDDDEIHLRAHDLNETFSTSIDEMRPVGDISWPNYILGAAAQFRKRGLPLRGFNAVLTSDIPIGAGLSSSAAVECATLFALDEQLKTGLDRQLMTKMAQAAEHEYAGVLCGIMDQFACMMGKKHHVIRLDCRSLDFEYVPLNLAGYKILLLNTNVKHSLASSEYNTRRMECKQAVDLIRVFEPWIQSLRDVTEPLLDRYVLPRSRLIDSRARYVVQENDRLLTACEDIGKDDIRALGAKMFETHEGLSGMYDVSCKELNWLADQARISEAVIGARMMGGGFGGCTINLVKQDKLETFIHSIRPLYEKTTGLPLDYYIVSIADGTSLL